MFKRLPEDKRQVVALTVDGRCIEARLGDSVAAALLAAGIAVFRTTPATGDPRGAYCMMGVCFDCLVSVDGIGSSQACLLGVRDGMKIETQTSARALADRLPET